MRMSQALLIKLFGQNNLVDSRWAAKNSRKPKKCLQRKTAEAGKKKEAGKVIRGKAETGKKGRSGVERV